MERMKQQKPDSSSLRANWIPLAVIFFVLGGIMWSIVHNVLVDSKTVASEAAEKTKFREDFPGLDEAKSLSATRKNEIIQQANRETCGCNCGYTVASCLVVDRSCPNRQKNLLHIKELIAGGRKSNVS